MNVKLMPLGALALMMACGTGTKHTVNSDPVADVDSLRPLKEVYDGKFMIGSAINAEEVSGADSLSSRLVRKHFNTIVAENCMKSEKINPYQGVYNWAPADSFVCYGTDNGMFIVGHCLVWHSQLAPWFVYDNDGNYVTADTLKQRMRTFITDVMTRYKGKVSGWDVVNEAIEDDGSYRRSPFYEILGEEYIPFAFEVAHEVDPDAELYINDYSMAKAPKRDRYVKIVNDLKNRGLRVDGIGIQAHMGMDYPDFAELEKSIDAFAATGCDVMLTEFDMSATPTITYSAEVSLTGEYSEDLDPYREGLPADVAEYWNARMDSVMDICERHADQISRVNFWGVADYESWKNDWPIKGRTEYPLLFDREHQMKPFMARRAAK